MDITVYITSDITSSERRISPQWDLHYLKQKIELITGVPPQFQTILLYAIPSSNENTVISDAESYNVQNDQSTTVAQLNIAPQSRLHILDTNPNSDLPDLSNADDTQHFELSKEEYEKRSNTVLQWKRTNQLGRFDPKFNAEKQRILEENAKVAASIKVGSRCRVINIQGERRGLVKFVGMIKALDDEESVWVGVEFDEPVGRNDGSIDGVQYFLCRKNHGSFLRPKQVEVGDFPEEDLFDSDEEI